MGVVAEVSDKIPPVAAFWCFHLLAAAVVLVLTVLSQRRAALILLLPLTIAWAAFFAYDALVANDPLGDVTSEMGKTYYLQQALAALMPAIAAICGMLMGRLTSRSFRRGFPVQ